MMYAISCYIEPRYNGARLYAMWNRIYEQMSKETIEGMGNCKILRVDKES